MYGKPLKLDWVARVIFLIQIPLTFSGHCNRPIWLTQCCTRFRSLGVKILCALYLHYKVAFTFKWYGNSWNKTFYSQRVWIGYNSELAELVYHYFDIYGWKCTGYQNLICSFSSCWQTFPKANYFVFTKSWSRDQLLPKEKKGGKWEVWVEVCLWDETWKLWLLLPNLIPGMLFPGFCYHV